MNDIDKIFKNKLNHYSTDVPEGIWDNIESELEHSKLRSVPKWPWMLTSVMTFVTLTVVGFYLFNAQQKGDIQNTKQEQSIINQEQITDNSLPIAQVFLPKSTIDQDATTPDINQNKYDISSAIAGKNLSKNSEVPTSSEVKPISIVLKNELIENTEELHNTYLQIAQNEPSTDFGEGLILDSHDQVISALVDNHTYTILKEDLPEIDMPSLSVITEPMKACPFNVNFKDKSLDILFSRLYR